MAVKKKFPYRAAFVACNGCIGGEERACQYGCIGCGECVSVCKFGAISIGAEGIAVVDEDACIGCGMCARKCPQQLIKVHECANYIVAACSNKEKGKAAKDACPRSCIGCGICERTCTAEAVKVKDNCAVIEETLCLSCGMCAVKCPRGVIRDLRGILTQ